MWGSIIGGGLSLAGSIVGGLSGGKEELSAEQRAQKEMNLKDMFRHNWMMDEYQNLYDQYYLPIEETLAKDYMTDYGMQRPYYERMRNYQLGRGDQLIDMAKETNPLLDESKKSIIRRLTEGEDVLRDKMRTEASLDVANAFDASREQGIRNMNMYGINPSSGAFSSFMSNMGTSQALGQAGARTQAARQAEDLSLSRALQAQSMYTNPNMAFSPTRPTPGMSPAQILGGSSGSMSSAGGSGGQQGGSGGGSGGDFWSGIGSGLGGLINAGSSLFGGSSGSKSGGTGIGTSGWTGGLGGGSGLLSGWSW